MKLHDLPYKTCHFYSSFRRNSSTRHARHIGNRSGTPLPICCHHDKIRSKSTDPAPGSQNPSNNSAGVSHRSHTCVGWGWFSRFRLFANVAAHRWGCCFWVVPNAWNAVFCWIPTVRRMANRLQAFFTVASADRKWSSEAGPDVHNGEIDWGTLSQSQFPATSGTAPLSICCRHGGKRSKSTWASLGQADSIEKPHRLTGLESGESSGMDYCTIAVDRSMRQVVTFTSLI